MIRMSNSDFFRYHQTEKMLMSKLLRKMFDSSIFVSTRRALEKWCVTKVAHCSTIPLLSKYKISRLQPSSVAVQPDLCGTWLETPKTGFLRTRLILLLSP